MKSIFRKHTILSTAALTVFLMVPLSTSAYLAAPIALTSAPTFVTERSAQLNGQVNANEMPDAYQWYEWGVTGRPDTVYETPHRRVSSGNKLVKVSTSLTGLAPNMQYFYRQVAESGRGKDKGMTTYFTTKSLPIVVTPIIIVQTLAPDTLMESSVDLNGYFSPHGNTSAQWWFEWGLTSSLENKTPETRAGSSNSGPVSKSLKGLNSGTTYFFRLVGENDLGRVYGATRVFVTHGVAPAVSTPSETPRDQTVQTPSNGDNVTRTETTSGAQKTASAQASKSSSGSFLDVLFGKKTNSATTTTSQSAITASNQVAGAGASTPVETFWSTLTGKKSVEVNIEKVGPKSVPAHTAIEYRITYAYRLDAAATDAKLKIILPENVVYIGDNTENELLLEESAGPERTYILPVGRLEKGSTRTISILGMTTGAANGTFPDARARLEFLDAHNVLQVVAAGNGVSTNTNAATAASSGSIFPSSLLGWLIYTLLIVGAIFAVRKAKAYYVRRKAEIEQEEADAARRSETSIPASSTEVIA